MARRKLGRLQIAGPILRAVMLRLGVAGFVTPWRTAYIAFDDARVIKHELVHLAQIRRDGDAKFWLKYAYFTIRNGYRGNPLEHEAWRLAGIKY